MRQRSRALANNNRPVVTTIVDATTGYGRNVLRGVMRYANAQRRWVIQTELRVLGPTAAPWPRSDGTIAAGVPTELLGQIRRRTKHFIHCSASADTKYGPVVCMDDLESGRIAAEHLLDCRLERYAFYGRAGWSASDQRLAGFRNEIEKHGHACLISPIEWQGMYAQTALGRRRLIAWLKALPRPIGIFAVDDSAASELAANCLRADIGVPDEVAIVGMNNDDLLCDSAWPPLSSVDADFSRVGYTAAAMLDRLFNGETFSRENLTVRLPPLGVVRRLSTDVLAVDDLQLAQAVRYIREHACDPDAMRQVLSHTAVDRRWLERQFKRKLDRTPHDEILRVRMQTAKRLLLQPNLQIDDIGVRCGFSSAPSLCRAFADYFDITPAAFRRSSAPSP